MRHSGSSRPGRAVVASEGVNSVNRRENQHARHDEERDADRTHAAGGGIDLTRARTLFARVARERGREPGLYVAVAVVDADRREEQFHRWDWRSEADALRAVGEACGRLDARARGARVQVHRAGGNLVGSALPRREVVVERRSSPRPAQASQTALERAEPQIGAAMATMRASLAAQQPRSGGSSRSRPWPSASMMSRLTSQRCWRRWRRGRRRRELWIELASLVQK